MIQKRPWFQNHGLFFGGGKGTRMLSKQIDEIRERIERTGIGLKEALSVIDMTFEDQIKRLNASSPMKLSGILIN